MESMYGMSRQELDFMWNYKDYIYVISNFIISIVAIIYLIRLLYLLFICLKCNSYTINIKIAPKNIIGYYREAAYILSTPYKFFQIINSFVLLLMKSLT